MALPFLLADASNYQFHKREQTQLQHVTLEQFLPTLGLPTTPPQTLHEKFARGLAEEALRWPLPPQWSEQFDDAVGAAYFAAKNDLARQVLAMWSGPHEFKSINGLDKP